jgi:excinuclease ABC subunit A
MLIAACAGVIWPTSPEARHSPRLKPIPTKPKISAASRDRIRIRGARQNNLKALDLDLPLNELIVVTGVSGSGKSSLAFDTVYSEGQRRYVETFSPYARQFLARMDKPRADGIEGIPPAIAIDQINPVRTSRSTVGTMTELNDHLKLLFARAASLFCGRCGRQVRRDTPESIYASIECRAAEAKSEATIAITFEVAVPPNFSAEEIEGYLAQRGYTRVRRHGESLEVVQDRLKFRPAARARIVDDLETALKRGGGRVTVRALEPDGEALRFSSALHCASCDIAYAEPLPNSFSFNSPIGACETCRGFGRVMGIDYDLVVPDARKSLAEGAVKPFQGGSYRECQDDLLRFAKRRGIPLDRPWRSLTESQRKWVIEGEGGWRERKWYGVRRFFAWLETKSYRMHIRVLLSKYRAYDVCPVCQGARLKSESLLWRLGRAADAQRVVDPAQRFEPPGMELDRARMAALPGLTIHDLLTLPIDAALHFFEAVRLPKPLDEASESLLGEIRTRLRYLSDVGLGYLTLDRQSRTLSGGEVQRINLTTALGTSLVNTLFVLDEPSIGLHPRDISRVIGVLKRLRDAGNTLLVVEHDAQVMLAADRVLDLGPGAGPDGGRLVFAGSPRELLRRRTITAEYLRGERRIERNAAGNDDPKAWLEVRGASEHNLKGIDVAFPLNRFVCVTGVSGSGKSTLVHDVLYKALRRSQGRPTEAPGEHESLGGAELIADVVLVDQSPIGRTTRSNPASFVGALTPIRELFAAEPLARQRGYTAGTFSFNTGNGRCPTCAGSGFERVEMQFLSDVYLRCADCDGLRYRREVLEVTLAPDLGNRARKPISIADVLGMTVTEALDFFSAAPKVLRGLRPLSAVGLDYVRLGQPVPTLSGGEAQRLKLAGHLAKVSDRKEGRGTLFLFDEPTTGLHFADVAKLAGALDELLARGHSVVVVEHNLELIRIADWVIDLGPEGGADGGRLLAAGPPAELARVGASHTGRCLARDAAGRRRAGPRSRPPARKPGRGAAKIEVVHAREHNLKNVDVSIPRERFTVITGVSGSGKSTLAFDILFAEGQRRYLESLNAYARQFVEPASRADVDAVFGIPPTIAIEQRTSRGGRKSTVATSTEIYHFLRLLFVKLGRQHCPDCRLPIDAQSPESILAKLSRRYRGRRIAVLSPLVTARKGYYTELAEWAAGKGYARLRVDGVFVSTAEWPRLDRFKEHTIELPVGEAAVGPDNEAALAELLASALRFGRGMIRTVDVDARRSSGELYSVERACPGCGRSFEPLDPRLFSYNSKHGWCPRCYGTGLELPGFDAGQSGEEPSWLEGWEGEPAACPACGGRRLRPEADAVYFKGRGIAEYTGMSVRKALAAVQRLKLEEREREIARDILPELTSRLRFLDLVGLGYLNLDRAAPTLSGGEAQRIRLAAQLGSNLRGVCYIMDEPTIGLHPRDNRLLLETVRELTAKGNTVVVVEHDEETIRRADHVIDLGPGAGLRGGELVVAGPLSKVLRSRRSETGRFLVSPPRHPIGTGGAGRATGNGRLEVLGASRHNLRDLDVSMPLRALVCVTGVSGSGKSSLVRDVLYANLKALLAAPPGRKKALRGCRRLRGWQSIRRVLEVDQTLIGKTPRSCPATYVGIWNEVRGLFARTTEARLRGYGPPRFSFNLSGGRCDSCEGQGLKKIEMSFLPDVRVPCERCNGARFNRETLQVEYKGRNVAQVLSMSVDEAVEFFAAHAKLEHILRMLADVGLGYLTLGQQSPTLSGGEAQRIKLVTELAKARVGDRARRGRPHTLYVLDEPTTGLHMADVQKLVSVLHRLVGAGNSVVVIEHNLDVIAEADWIVDLGPEGGDRGGRIVAQGTPDRIIRRAKSSPTARALAEFLAARAVPESPRPRRPDRGCARRAES